MNRSQDGHAGAAAEQARDFTHLQPTDAVSVYLYREFVERLRTGVLEKSAAKTELGGVLFGRKRFDGSHRSVEILDYQAIEGKHSSAFLPNRTDFLSIVEICSVRRTDDLIAVGLFRSRGDGAVRLDPGDAGLADRFFSGPESIFLVLRPASDDTVAGGLFLPAGGESFEAGTTAVELDMSPAGVTITASTPAPPVTHELAPVPEPPAPVHADPSPEYQEAVEYAVPAWLNEAPTGRRERRADPPAWNTQRRSATAPRWALAAIAVSVVAAAAFTGAYFWRRLAAPPAEPESIRVDRDGTDLRATWNRRAPLFRGAQKAALSIRDGNEAKEIGLDLRLDSGMVLYTPRSSDVEFRITVSGKTERTESIRVLAPATPGAQWTSTMPAPASGTPPVQTRGVAKLQTPVMGTASRHGAILPESQPTTEAAENRPEPKAFVPPDSRVVEDIASLPAPPGVGSGQGVVDLRRAAAPLNARTPRLPAPPPSAAPPAPRPVAPALSRVPSVKPPVSSPDTFTRPKPKVQIPPRISPLMRATIGETSVVSVTVEVDKAGKVTVARLTNTTTSNKALQNLAMDAAKRWEFEPATLNGRPVPSEVVLNFTYGPQR